MVASTRPVERVAGASPRGGYLHDAPAPPTAPAARSRPV